jgi:hypothetical protein
LQFGIEYSWRLKGRSKARDALENLSFKIIEIRNPGVRIRNRAVWQIRAEGL